MDGTGFSEASESASHIDVTITGALQTRFTARWEIRRQDGRLEVIEEQGRVPVQRRFESAALAVEIMLIDEGPLSLSLNKKGSHSGSSTSGAGSRFSVSVA